MIRINSYSCAGERGENEDALVIQAHPQDSTCQLFAIADGQGGRCGGGTAARLACRRCVEVAADYSPALLGDPRCWSRILQAVDQTVHNETEAGFTTLVGFCIASEAICGSANGDSAVLSMVDGSEGKILTAGQPKNPPVGSGQVRCKSFSATLGGSWTILAMSDGVWKYTGWDPIFRSVARKESAAIIEFLRRYAALPDSGRLQDDFTLLVIQSDELTSIR